MNSVTAHGSTVEITTKTVDSFFPYQMLWFLISSPAQYEKLGKDWDKFASQPSGTGPFKLTKLVPRELAELRQALAGRGPRAAPIRTGRRIRAQGMVTPREVGTSIRSSSAKPFAA